jgi:hypothetical protein
VNSALFWQNYCGYSIITPQRRRHLCGLSS